MSEQQNMGVSCGAVKLQSIELSPVECTVVLIALQDYIRFSNDAFVGKVGNDLFSRIDEKRRVDTEFFKNSVNAGAFIVNRIAEGAKA